MILSLSHSVKIFNQSRLLNCIVLLINYLFAYLSFVHQLIEIEKTYYDQNTCEGFLKKKKKGHKILGLYCIIINFLTLDPSKFSTQKMVNGNGRHVCEYCKSEMLSHATQQLLLLQQNILCCLLAATFCAAGHTCGAYISINVQKLVHALRKTMRVFLNQYKLAFSLSVCHQEKTGRKPLSTSISTTSTLFNSFT